jgi:hypothetical protein
MDSVHFDWDEGNLGHLKNHRISPEEPEQVILNRPIDRESYIRNGEERTAQIG